MSHVKYITKFVECEILKKTVRKENEAISEYEYY